jgi:metallo-beta-lactamase family protein|tara:strand:+ start:153021 stop:153299 length:279 start_codon:yes stop_codon:yes gene_type:complete
LRYKGKVLIPAFSFGWTQEQLYELEGIIHRCTTRGDDSSAAPDMDVWPSLPIILDSPLASRFTEAIANYSPSGVKRPSNEFATTGARWRSTS